MSIHKLDTQINNTDKELLINELLENNVKRSLIKFHPVQDFVEEKIYYGFKDKYDNIWVVNSAKELIPFTNLNDMKPVVDNIDSNKFPIHLLKSYLGDTLMVNPSAIFSDIKNYIERYTQFHNELDGSIISLWIMGTYVFKMFTYFPYIHLSGEKGSGKTNLMFMLKPIVFNGSLLNSPTAAILFRSTHYNMLTLLLDEAEKFFKGSKTLDNTDIGAILNSGFHREGNVIRTDMEKYIPKSFSTYCPKMIANISSVENVLSDRMITIRMLRKTDLKKKYIPTESNVQKLHQELSDNLYIFGLLFSDSIYFQYKNIQQDVELEKKLPNRSLDIWSPLLAIARVADPSENLYRAILNYATDYHEDRMSNDIEENDTAKLFDILWHIIVGEKVIDSASKDDLFFTVPTNDLHGFLNSKGFNFGKSTHKLTTKLKPILSREPKNIRDGEKQGKNYIIELDKFYPLHKAYCQ